MFEKKRKIFNIEVHELRGAPLYGLQTELNGAQPRQVLPALSERFHKRIGVKPGGLLPLYVIRRKQEGKEYLFIGSAREHSGLETLDMATAPYARIVVQPKMSIFWTGAVEEARKYFFEEWLPASDYSYLGPEFELHSEKSMKKKPELDLFFALERRADR